MGNFRLTRREFIQATAGGVASVVLVGCGGSGGSGRSGAGKATVTFDPLFLASGPVVALHNGKTVPVSDTGAATLVFPSKAPTLVSLFKPESGDLVALCYVDPTQPKRPLDVKNCAATLLHQALGGYQYVGSARSTRFAEILEDPSLPPLVAAIRAALESDPLAFTNRTAVIRDALATAVGSGRSISSLSSRAETSGAESRSRAEGDKYFLSAPAPEFTDVNEMAATDNTYTFATSKPPEALVFSYLTATATDSQTTPVQPPQQLIAPVSVPRSVGGASARLSVTPGLPMSPDRFAEVYKMIVFRPVFGASDPSLFSESGFQGLVSTWRSSLEPLFQRAATLFFCMVVAEAAGQTINPTTSVLTQIAPALRQVDSALLAAIDHAKSGTNLAESVYAMLQATTSPTVSTKLIQTLTPLILNAVSPGEVAKALSSILQNFLQVGVVSAASLHGPVAKAHQAGDLVQSYQGKATQASFVLNVNSAYTPGASVTASMTFAPEVVDAGTAHFKCSISGDPTATLSDGSQTGRSFDTAEQAFQVLTTSETKSELTLAVEMFGKKDGKEKSFGRQTAKIVMGIEIAFSTTPVVLRYPWDTARLSLAKTDHLPEDVEYRWTTSFGGLVAINANAHLTPDDIPPKIFQNQEAKVGYCAVTFPKDGVAMTDTIKCEVLQKDVVIAEATKEIKFGAVTYTFVKYFDTATGKSRITQFDAPFTREIRRTMIGPVADTLDGMSISCGSGGPPPYLAMTAVVPKGSKFAAGNSYTHGKLDAAGNFRSEGSLVTEGGWSTVDTGSLQITSRTPGPDGTTLIGFSFSFTTKTGPRTGITGYGVAMTRE